MPHSFDNLILDHTPDAVIITKPDGTVVHWNKGAEVIFGYTSQETVGHSVNEMIVPREYAEEDRTALHATIETGFSTYESLRQRKDGSFVYVAITRKVLKDAEGRPEYILSSKKDITDLKVMRDAKFIEAKFRDLLESVPDGIVMANPTGRIVLTNSHAERLFGYERGELLGRLVEVLLPARYRGGHTGHRATYFAQPRARPMGAGLELYGLRKDGAEFPVEISLSPIETEEGTVVMSAIRDVTERKKAEQKFRDLLESAPDAIVIVNREGNIILVNSQTERLFGYPREELLGKSIEILVPESFRQKHADYRGDYFAHPHVRAMSAGLDLRGLRKDGTEFPVEISLSPLETEEGTLVASAIRDITDRKEIERVLRDKNIELQNAAETKNRFLANVSHELRTPLNAIIGFTGTLLMKLPGPLTADQEKQLTTIKTSARHLLSLINDLLDLARIESGKVELNFERVNCVEVIEEVSSTLRPLAGHKHLQFDVRMPEGPVYVNTDRRYLNQILINLANNAIKFTEEGSVRMELVQRSEGESVETEFAVVDTGVGIKPEDQTRLFQAFTQVDASSTRRYEGTGLGLHLCQKLADLIGGRIRFESVYGKGSRFALVLNDPGR